MQSIIDFSGPIENQHIKEMEKHNKFSKKDAETHFDEVALNYEAVYMNAGYPDPKKVQEAVSSIATSQIIPKHRAEILDLGCGTGLVGKYLKEDGGFENIRGIDVSGKMLDQAETKGCYKHLIQL
jgi:predicted TPR repeat methyltransferase